MVFEDNMKAMGIDISGLTNTVISHGHYDHTGAIRTVAEKNPGINIIAHPEAL